jgi:hypothetical protein
LIVVELAHSNQHYLRPQIYSGEGIEEVMLDSSHTLNEGRDYEPPMSQYKQVRRKLIEKHHKRSTKRTQTQFKDDMLYSNKVFPLKKATKRPLG